MLLSLGAHTYDLARRVMVMTIVNRTPDSFYDRGAAFALDAALDAAMTAVGEGADLIDVGGVKVGPGAAVGTEEELERVVPFVEAFCDRSDVPVSVDTFRAVVAREALAAGATLINDVTGLSEPEVADAVAARPRAGLVVTHAGGPPRTRPYRPVYSPDVTTAVTARLRDLVAQAVERGVPGERIVVDPGHDLGKNTFHSLELSRRLGEITALGQPVLVALSRKDFLGETLGGLAPEQRLEASLGAAVSAVHLGAHILRVHDTAATVRAVRTAEAILGRRPPSRAVRGLT